MRLLHPLSSTPRASRNSACSSGVRLTSSSSTFAETTTALSPVFAATSITFSVKELPSASSSSETLAAKIIDFFVSNPKFFTAASSFSSSSNTRAGFPSIKTAWSFSSAPFSMSAPVILFLTSFTTLTSRLSIWSMSAKINSKLIVSMSRTGSTSPSTCVMLSSSKHRTTCTIASHSRMSFRNLLPSPSPFEAPFTSPAMSTYSICSGMTLKDSAPSAS
mmetsp:Transcript_31420/g.72888  ORF Transcript_31420/g.72888 Transcript_31420/m.72888 type:complete len:219 (-) Transcript_31420:10-666(-)